jgi:hypoxanthine phosphoribosyltransferase
MSTSAYLDSLNYEQLQWAKEYTQKLIDKKEQDEKIRVWYVNCEITMSPWFIAKEKAKEWVKENINKLLDEGKFPKIEIQSMHVRESELAELDIRE